MKICVFCSSSDNLDAKYVDAAKALGETIAARGHELVFGGYDKGLMGDVANAAVAAGGRVFGVTTTGLTAKGRAIVEGIENVEEPDLSTRIKHMVSMSDAFVTLPGGLGTFEEFFSVMSQIKAGELKAIGNCYESFGIIVNTKLLEEAGHSLDEIKDFDSLKAVADDIHARADELGFDAFSSAGLDGSSSWRFSGHLANMPLYYEFRDDGVTAQPATITGAYLDNFKNIWDLYVNDSADDPTTLSTATKDESCAEFTEGKAVFYQNGTWEYSGLIDAGMTDDQLAMIPIYCGVDGEENAALCSGTENCWAINSKASEEDIQASMDFLVWLVTDPDASAVYVEQLGAVPLKNCAASSNKFIVDGSKLLSEGKYAVTWAFNYTPNVDSWRATVVTALAAYSADQSDANWQQVVSAFVDGWAIEYDVVNG